jgi:riboflavin kinase/FMN adenylyltransferase
VEAHVLDFEGDLYERAAAVELCARLRPEERFSSVSALTTQIGRDIARARELLAEKRN